LEQEQAILEERDRTKALIAGDLHDDVASTLGGIAFYAASLRSGLQEGPIARRDQLDRIITLLNEAQEAVHDIVWSATPRHDTMEELLWRVKDHASQLPGTRDCGTIDMPKSIEDRGCRIDFSFLIYKEAMTNIINHAQAAPSFFMGNCWRCVHDGDQMMVVVSAALTHEGTVREETNDSPRAGKKYDEAGGNMANSIRSTVGQGPCCVLL
jgi:hypothetical protein